MKPVSALLCVLSVLLSAGSAFAGSGKAVVTNLVPVPPVVEEKTLPSKKECVTVERKTVSVEPSRFYSIQPVFFENCGCCGAQTYMQGTYYFRPEQPIKGVSITTDCE